MTKETWQVINIDWIKIMYNPILKSSFRHPKASEKE